MKKQQPEFQLQRQLCLYLKIQYKEILFLSDTIASVKLTIPQQMRNKSVQKPEFACPDLMILEPRNGFSGLFIELKVKSPFNKNGELLKSDHLENQQKTINELNKKGYKALFSWGFDKTKDIIDEYLK